MADGREINDDAGNDDNITINGRTVTVYINGVPLTVEVNGLDQFSETSKPMPDVMIDGVPAADSKNGKGEGDG